MCTQRVEAVQFITNGTITRQVVISTLPVGRPQYFLE
jgi:hypothetical protein